ncbi:MAG: tRNA (adenosine(37)-N6)-dimethylallyltransferase MiaA, partial [Pseudomonadota bacterium]|nr:tRNA (adenosine(37)-N6)-dimethylallyltransferase MiaA [Pseudomonadota bacterium]
KPDAGLQARVAHHLIDLRKPWQRYSAAEFAADAKRAIDDIVARGKLPVLAGGTSLYFHALLNGLSAMPDADPAVRAQITAQAAVVGWPALHAELTKVDPDAAVKIHTTDPQRIQRALEVHRLTGKPISAWQREQPHGRLPLRVLKLVLAPRDRSVLHARIAYRFDAMLEQGFLQEVRHLRAKPELQRVESPLDLPALRAVGYRQAWEYMDDDPHMSNPSKRFEFRDRAIFATRQLAKRQLTWLRGDLDARWFDPQHEAPELEAALALFLNGTAVTDRARGLR